MTKAVYSFPFLSELSPTGLKVMIKRPTWCLNRPGLSQLPWAFLGKNSAEWEQVPAGITSPASKKWSSEKETSGRLFNHSPCSGGQCAWPICTSNSLLGVDSRRGGKRAKNCEHSWETKNPPWNSSTREVSFLFKGGDQTVSEKTLTICFSWGHVINPYNYVWYQRLGHFRNPRSFECCLSKPAKDQGCTLFHAYKYV